jgi:hypothetical protein
MADERDPATEDHGHEATRRMPADEPTSTFNPFSDDDEDADPEATRAMPADAEATRAMPADAEATRKVTPQIWAGRASVPLNDPEPVPGPTAAQWQEETAGEDVDGSWLRPVAIAVVVLILLAMLGTGLWLIFNRSGGPSAPAPGITATASGIPTPTGTPTAPTTTAPTTTAPTAAAQVAVPDLVGQSEAVAKQQLTAMGLAFTVTRRAGSGVNPGTVLATEPGAGARVAAGSQVTLVVAAAPAPTTAAPSKTAPPTRPVSPSAVPSG